MTKCFECGLCRIISNYLCCLSPFFCKPVTVNKQALPLSTHFYDIPVSTNQRQVRIYNNNLKSLPFAANLEETFFFSQQNRNFPLIYHLFFLQNPPCTDYSLSFLYAFSGSIPSKAAKITPNYFRTGAETRRFPSLTRVLVRMLPYLLFDQRGWMSSFDLCEAHSASGEKT